MLISCARSRSHVAEPIFKLVGFIHSLMPRFLNHSNIAVMIFRLSIGSPIPTHTKVSVTLRQSKAMRGAYCFYIGCYRILMKKQSGEVFYWIVWLREESLCSGL